MNKRHKTINEGASPALAGIAECLPILRSEMDVIADGMIVLDADGKVVLLNTAAKEIIGLKASAAQPETIADLREQIELCTLDGTVIRYDDWPWTRVLRGEAAAQAACRVRSAQHGNGEQAALMHALALRDKDAQPLGVLGTLHRLSVPVSPFSTANEKPYLREARSSLRLLAGTVAHEVKNPLSAAQIAAQFVLNNDALPESLRADVAGILEEVRHCVRIVTRVQQFAYAGTARRTQHDLNDIITASRELLQIVASRGRAVVEFHLEDAPLPATVSESEVEQVLLNAVENAVQASTPGQRIEVASRRDGDMARISIRDEGAGMSEYVRDHAQAPFFSTRYSLGAPGLGLSIAAHIAEAHGGRLEVESERDNGTKITILMPLEPSS